MFGFETIHLVGGVLGLIVVFFLLVAAYSSRYLKAGPNEVLVVSGRKYRSPSGHVRGFRLISGGGVFVWPIIEKADRFSLETMTIEVKTPEVYTSQGVLVSVDGVAQIKVKNDDVSIATAVEQFLTKSSGQLVEIARQTLEGHLRAIIGTISVEEIIRNRDVFAQKVQEVSAADLANMGLSIVSFTIKDIKDAEGYLDALGKPQIAAIKRDALIAEAEAQRDATIKSAEAKQAGEMARYVAETKIAESQKNYKVQLADYSGSVNERQAEADLAYDLQKFRTQQSVKAEEIQVKTVEKTKEIEVQEKEILRKEKELIATVQKPADAERYRIETYATAEQFKLKTTADGESEATKLKGAGTAEAQKSVGFAEAQVIQAKGFAEAEAMNKKSVAWKMYNEAAVLQMFIEKMPEIVKAVSEPLSKIDRYVVINNGNGKEGGASKITGEVTNVLSQLPPLVEALTGVNLEGLIKNLPKIATTIKENAANPENKGQEG